MKAAPTHCAKFSDDLLPAARHLLACVAGLPAGARVLDPFAGTGKGVDYLANVCGFTALGIELEPEWAAMSKRVSVGNALGLRYRKQSFDAVFTSPTYGNRMADRDARESVAGTYMKSLGREASPSSSNHLQWGPKYREFHEAAWAEVKRVLRPGGFFLLNIKDHFRGGELQGVPAWHHSVLIGTLGFQVTTRVDVAVPSLGFGANRDARAEYEHLWLYRLGDET